jgi:hypothetical protein
MQPVAPSPKRLPTGLEVICRCPSAVQHEGRNYGQTVWVALRARCSEWTQLTQAEALALGEFLVCQYGAESKGMTEVDISES